MDTMTLATVTLRIENTYDDGDTIITTIDTTVPLPVPTGEQERTDWETDHIFLHTGTGHESGQAWYDVTVTASSEASLVGMTFAFGY